MFFGIVLHSFRLVQYGTLTVKAKTQTVLHFNLKPETIKI